MADVIRTDFSNAHGEITRLVIVHGPEDGLDTETVTLAVPPGFGGPAPDTIGKEQPVLGEPPGLMSPQGPNTPIKP
jgi:hypothetical protein